MINLLFKISIGTCIYIHDQWLGLAYLVYYFNTLYIQYKDNKELQDFKESFNLIQYEKEAGQAVRSSNTGSGEGDGNGTTWQ